MATVDAATGAIVEFLCTRQTPPSTPFSFIPPQSFWDAWEKAPTEIDILGFFLEHWVFDPEGQIVPLLRLVDCERITGENIANTQEFMTTLFSPKEISDQVPQIGSGEWLIVRCPYGIKLICVSGENEGTLYKIEANAGVATVTEVEGIDERRELIGLKKTALSDPVALPNIAHELRTVNTGCELNGDGRKVLAKFLLIQIQLGMLQKLMNRMDIIRHGQVGGLKGLIDGSHPQALLQLPGQLCRNFAHA